LLCRFIALVQDGERRVATRVPGVGLSETQSASDIPLSEGATSPRAEHEVGRLDIRRSGPMRLEDDGQLTGDRHSPSRSVRLRRAQLAVPIDLK
jgi:hypothetical protein